MQTEAQLQVERIRSALEKERTMLTTATDTMHAEAAEERLSLRRRYDEQVMIGLFRTWFACVTHSLLVLVALVREFMQAFVSTQLPLYVFVAR